MDAHIVDGVEGVGVLATDARVVVDAGRDERPQRAGQDQRSAAVEGRGVAGVEVNPEGDATLACVPHDVLALLRCLGDRFGDDDVDTAARRLGHHFHAQG